jgi:hypothetical protein
VEQRNSILPLAVAFGILAFFRLLPHTNAATIFKVAISFSTFAVRRSLLILAHNPAVDCSLSLCVLLRKIAEFQ